MQNPIQLRSRPRKWQAHIYSFICKSLIKDPTKVNYKLREWMQSTNYVSTNQDQYKFDPNVVIAMVMDDEAKKWYSFCIYIKN
jgi:hypothetical protein